MSVICKKKENNYKSEKSSQKIATHENGLTQKEVQWANHLGACLLKNGWLRNLPKKNGG